MNSDYERFQLQLILNEYESNGYRVTAGATLGSANFHFDAIAEKVEDGSVVVIELVNKSSDPGAIKRRLIAFDSLSTLAKPITVDFRYIDRHQGALMSYATDATKSYLAGKVDQAALTISGKTSPATRLLSNWYRLAREIRELAGLFGMTDAGSRDTLDLYNEILSRDVPPAEQTDDHVDLDLFQLYDLVLLTIEGGRVPDEAAKQADRHLKSLRKHRQRLKLGS